jgi:hypothetical protein
MGFWLSFFIYLGVTLLVELIRPQPDFEEAKPASLGDFQFPTADEGRTIPIIWGTVRVNGPNIGWFGDLRTVKITKKIKTGLITSKRITTGYRYFLGIDLMICRGEFDPLVLANQGVRRIWVDDVILRDENASWVTSGTIDFNEPTFFGDRDQEGGITGTMRIYPGKTLEVQNAYMAGLPEIDGSLLPNYNGTARAVMEGMEIGNRPQIPPFNFEVRRIPNGLGLSAGDLIINGFDANPANVIYEIMTNSEWGLGYTNINVANFQAAGVTLAAEGNGYSRIMDRPQKAKDLLSDIQQQIDGFVIKDPISQQWELKLIRESDYPSPVTALPLFDENNIIADGFEFSRGAWSDTNNHVKVGFTDRDKEYNSTFAVAQDMANRIIQNDEDVSTTIKMPGVMTRSLANDIAWRELRTLSYPLAKGKIKANRTNVNLQPGDLARVNWPPYGIEDLYIRIIRVNLGSGDANEIVYDFNEDIFRQETPSFADPALTLWTEIDDGAVNANAVRLIDLPLGFSEDPTKQQYGLMVSRGNGLQITYDIYFRESGTYPVTPLRTTQTLLAVDVAPFTPTALLSGPLAINQGSPNSFNNDSIIIDTGTDIAEIQTTAVVSELDSDFSLSTPPNLILIDDEWIFYESITDLGSGTYRLNNCYRGMLDSAVAAHDDNSIVWFVSEGLAEIVVDWISSTQGFGVWIMSNAGGGQQGDPNGSPFTESPAKGVFADQQITKRFEGPCAPVNVSIDGVRLGDVDQLGDSFNINWRNRVNSNTVRSKNQEATNDAAISGVDYTVRIYHTGQSPEALVYNQTGILANAGISPLGGTHAVSGYAVDFSPITSPWPSPQPFAQTYRIEVEAETTGSPTVTSQMWKRDFERA